MSDDAVLASILDQLCRIEAKVDSHHATFSTELRNHMEEETSEVASMMEIIQSHREESDRKHTALLQSITAYMERQAAIEAAFLKNAEGKPDFEGHHADHNTRKTRSLWWSNFRDKIVQKVGEWAAVLFLTWLGYNLWIAFLQGPK